MAVLAAVFTLLRLGVRLFHIKKLHADDFLAIAGVCCLIILACLNQYQSPVIYALISASKGEVLPPPYDTQLGLGLGLVYQAKLQFAFMIVFWTSLWCIKFSFLLFYHNLFVGIQGYMRWWWGVVIFSIMTYVASLLTLFLSCLPFRQRFSIERELSFFLYNCLAFADVVVETCPIPNAIAALIAATTIDISSDILVMVLPIRLLWGLRVSNTQKAGLGAIFSLGLVIVIFAIIRVVEVVEAINNSSPSVGVSLGMWSILETSIGKFCCLGDCQQCIGFLLTWLFQHVLSAVFRP